MTSAIDPTHPATGVAVSKQKSRDNWQAAKDEIEALQAGLAVARLPAIKSEGGTSITVNAAYFGETGMVIILAANASAVTVTLAADVPAGKSVHLVQRGAGTPTAVASDGATLTIPSGATASPSAQHGSVVFVKVTATEWLVVDRGGSV